VRWFRFPQHLESHPHPCLGFPVLALVWWNGGHLASNQMCWRISFALGEQNRIVRERVYQISGMQRVEGKRLVQRPNATLTGSRATDHVVPIACDPASHLENLGVPRENGLPRTWVHRFVAWYSFLHGPSQKRMRVLALLLHGKVGVWSRTTFDPKMSNHAGIGIAHEDLTKHIDAVVCVRRLSQECLEARGSETYRCVHVVHVVGR